MTNKAKKTSGKKQPCFLCGNRSVAWIIYNNEAKRVCEKCALNISTICFDQGSSVAATIEGEPDIFLCDPSEKNR